MATRTSLSTNPRLARFLSGQPPENVSVTTVHFDTLGLTEYKDHFAILIDNLFSRSECEALIEGAEQSTTNGWEQAMVNVGNGRQKLKTDVRLCDRIIWDNREIADKIMDRIIPYLPSDIVTLTDRPMITGNGPAKRKEVWKMSRMNERLRFLRYTKGMYFRTHCDGSYVTPDQKEITFLTVHLYLNGNEAPSTAYQGAERNQDKPLLGGATRFVGFDLRRHWDVNPRAGSVLVFQHRNLMHSGEDVSQGTKYTVRSDVLYRKVDT